MICSDLTCKYCSDNYKCKFPKKDLSFSHHSVMTLYQGRQDYLKCNAYEPHEMYIKIQTALGEIDLEKDFREWEENIKRKD